MQHNLWSGGRKHALRFLPYQVCIGRKERSMRLIDADALKAQWEKVPEILNMNPYGDLACAIIQGLHKDMLASIDAQRTIFPETDKNPAVNVLSVVRCNECHHFDRISPCSRYGYCHAANSGSEDEQSGLIIKVRRKIKDDYFCADGIREQTLIDMGVHG